MVGAVVQPASHLFGLGSVPVTLVAPVWLHISVEVLPGRRGELVTHHGEPLMRTVNQRVRQPSYAVPPVGPLLRSRAEDVAQRRDDLVKSLSVPERISPDAQGLGEGHLLETFEQCDQWMEVTIVGPFEGVDVGLSIAAVHDKGKPPWTKEHEGGDRLGDPAIAILEGMDLSEAVLQPRGLDLDRDAGGDMLSMEVDEAIHLRGDLLRGAVLVNDPVVPGGVVRQKLPCSPPEGHFHELSELVPASGS